MKYHQAGKISHGERTTVLAKLPDKYIYNINYPTTFEDITRFETDNEIAVFVYYINDDGTIRTEKWGDPNYILNDVIYLLRIENEDNAHYIYIKHLENVLILIHVLNQQELTFALVVKRMLKKRT